MLVKAGCGGKPEGELTHPVGELKSEGDTDIRVLSTMYCVQCVFMALSARLWLRADGWERQVDFFFFFIA